MAHLIKLQDGQPALLFYRPETRVFRLVGVSYAQASVMLKGRVTEHDSSAGPWGRVVAKHDGVLEVALASTDPRI